MLHQLPVEDLAKDKRIGGAEYRELIGVIGIDRITHPKTLSKKKFKQIQERY